MHTCAAFHEIGFELILYIRWGNIFSVKFKTCLFIFSFIPCLPTVKSTIAEQDWLKYLAHVVALWSGVLGCHYGLVVF